MAYEIIIRQGDGAEDKSNLAGGSKKTAEEKALAKTKNQMAGALKYAALQSTRELVVSRVGEFTRNNLLQQQIDAGINIAQTAMAFAVNPWLGAVTLATQVLSSVITYQTNVTKEAHRLGVTRERAGYMNRSR